MHPKIESLAKKHAAEMAALFVEIARESIGGRAISKAASTVSKSSTRGAKADPDSKAGHVRAFLAENPWSSLQAIVDGTGVDKKYVAVLVLRLVKSGAIQKRGDRGGYEYAAAPALKAVA
jgi:hypothetical protein